jgi:hypothetical protein
MRTGRVALLVAIALLVAACSGDDDTTTATSPRATATSTTTTTTAPGPPATIPSDLGRRTVEVRDVDLAAGEALGFALHPGSDMRISAAGDLEVCPATTDGAIDLTGGSWPGDLFESCLPLRAGPATVPAPPSTYHVGFAVRARGGGATTVDEVSLDYEAVDGFFAVFFTALDADRPSADVVVTPTRSTTVVAGTGTAGPQVELEQRGAQLPAYAPTPRYEGRPYGPATLDEPVTMRVVVTKPTARVMLFLEWA